ncbi:hypothetical protein [Acidihalobacter prosperus]|uniref:Heme exporter protein D n=1 Tax=Acidihalobacter prosperus TaxID=160660 RepID=A0A1A6C2Z4_9GAMM|nr:hypothetical protein [Acidihalobacter prosperus]OBS08928.1 hypothetical protein Thpro_022126 [Acidihalobacter prosperus]
MSLFLELPFVLGLWCFTAAAMLLAAFLYVRRASRLDDEARKRERETYEAEIAAQQRQGGAS